MAIKAEDVDLIVRNPAFSLIFFPLFFQPSSVLLLQLAELDISRPAAERALREHGGNLKDTLKALVNA